MSCDSEENSNHLADPKTWEALPARARGPHSPMSCWLTGRMVSPEGRAGCKLQPGSHLSAQEGRKGGREAAALGEEIFLPLFSSCRTQQIKPPRTANQQLILAQIPQAQSCCSGDSCTGCSPGKAAAFLAEAALWSSSSRQRKADRGAQQDPVLETMKPLTWQVIACLPSEAE